uniref:UDP-glucuronosyltransferase n=1 Tax=Culicoides sonorensis TaxID=179676 RepID=A0A336KLR3_CULSO
MIRNILIFIILCTLLTYNEAANIVFLSPVASPSHHNWNRNIYYALADKGHNVTVLSPDVDREITKNVHYIKIEGMYEALYNGSDQFNFVEMTKVTKFQNTKDFWEFCTITADVAAASKGLQTLLNYPETFKVDLLMLDLTVGPYMLGFLNKFNYPPTVAVTAFSYPHYMFHSFGGHRQPAYMPHHEADFPNEMSLYQRLFNQILTWYDDYLYLGHFLKDQDKLMRQIFKNDNLPYVLDLTKKIGLLLSNTHFAVEKMQPLPTNVITVGGLQIRPPKPLDNELKSFIEAGKKGTVLFSLGTNMKSSLLDKSIIQMFLNVFNELPHFHFIWKYETDLDLKIPKNVKLQGWVRQNDILAHPNVKGFISHCGLLGTQEAIWHGVPIIGIPFFADQLRNILSIIRAGVGVKVDFNTISHESLKAALVEALENPKYLENAKKRSRLFQDQVDAPLDRAVFWIEWAMRHKDDMDAIASPVKDIGWFVGNGYDVLLIILIVFFISFQIIKCVIQSILSKICSKKSVTKSKKRN